MTTIQNLISAFPLPNIRVRARRVLQSRTEARRPLPTSRAHGHDLCVTEDHAAFVVGHLGARGVFLAVVYHSYLCEQLEALRTFETRTPRRDLLKLAPSGTGPEASQHDDAAIALGLCLIDDRVRNRIGRTMMAEHDRRIVED